MDLGNLIYSFRARLLVVLAALVVLTLGVQYYFNYRAQEKTSATIAEQERALTAAMSLALESMNTGSYMKDLRAHYSTPLLDPQTGPVKNILIVKDQDRIEDSLDEQYLPVEISEGRSDFKTLADLHDNLPPIVTAGDIDEVPLQRQTPAHLAAGESRAFQIKAETSKGPKYIIVVLGPSYLHDKEIFWRSARPLVPTLAIMLSAIMISGMLVWRFTQPISDLSGAAHRVAAGDFNFRVPSAERRDEMGALASGFNEMIARLGSMRELEVRLHQAERSAVVGRLASAIAHEIRNPLNYINLTLDHLRTSLAPDDPDKRATFERLATQLKAEVARINTRISEFLNYTRPSKLEMHPLDLRTLIDDSLQMVEVQAVENGVKLKIEQAEQGLPLIEGDRESLRSVFTNLIINGLQAIDGAGGQLTIALAKEAGQVLVSVSDTGPGIAPEHLPQVFEPYFSTKETGTGLGLAIVEKAVEDHGGTVSVESVVGQGTTFTVKLPIAHTGNSPVKQQYRAG